MALNINRQTIIELLVDHYAELIPNIFYPQMEIYCDYPNNQILIYQQYTQPTLRIIIHETTFAVDYWNGPVIPSPLRADYQSTVPVFDIEWAHPESINCLDILVKIFIKDPDRAFTGRMQLVHLEPDYAGPHHPGLVKS